MFKKLFNSLTGDNGKEENQAPENPTNEPAAEVQFDAETLHGTHYSVEDFDEEVERRVNAWLTDEEDRADIDNIRFNIRREVYQEWTGADTDQMLRWEMANSLQHKGVASSGYAKEDDGNPYLQPVHGISLRDYTAMCLKISSGIDYKEVCRAMGLEPVIWEELNTIWPQRMAEDSSFTVSVLFGQYYAEPATHPKLQGLQAQVTEEGAANLEKMKTDRYFYHELTAARQAAYEYGLDGAQWIFDNYGINLADFQSVAMKYLEENNKNFNSSDILHYQDYQDEKQKEYAEKFAAEQGGNIADDVEF